MGVTPHRISKEHIKLVIKIINTLDTLNSKTFSVSKWPKWITLLKYLTGAPLIMTQGSGGFTL